MAAPSTHSSVAVEQEAFAQRKLEELYHKTCERLRPYRNWIELTQEVFVWRKPAASLALYGAIHWMFIYFVHWNGSLLTGLSSFLFWLLLGDILWRAATRDGESGGQGQQRESRAHSQRRSISREVSFDTVLVQASTPIGSQQLAPFEIICLRVARGLMWGDNLRLALQHWRTSEPVIFTVMIAMPGVILSLLGKYIPTIVLAYVAVMGVVVWPYIEYHNLRTRALQFTLTHFPAAVQQAKSAWAFLKAVAISRDDGDHPEFSLKVGDGEEATQQTLQHAFDQATAQPKEGGGGQGGEEGNRRGGGGGGRTRDPGLSLLQDSVLGLHPNAFHNAELDSFSTSYLGPGEFPSITNFDHSGSALPHFPQEANRPMPTIQEEEGPQDDLDPYMDSVEVEFGRVDFPDGRTAQRPKLRHPLTTVNRNPHRYGLSTSNSSTHDPYAPSAPPLMDNFDRRTPPPRYEDIVPNAGMCSPGGGSEQLPYSGSLGFDTQYMPLRGSPTYEQTIARAGGMAPRSSSTPLVDGNPAGLRYREVHRP